MQDTTGLCPREQYLRTTHEPKLTAGVCHGAACKPIKIPEHVRDKLLGGGIPEHWFVDEPVEGWDGCHPNHVCRN